MDVLKRFPIKYVRDYIKKDYKIRDKCFICGSKDNLELHHLYSLSQLWEAWCREHNLKKVESVEIIKQLRVTFAKDYNKIPAIYPEDRFKKSDRDDYIKMVEKK